MTQTEYRSIKDLKKLPGNPRVIKNAQFKTLCESIKNLPGYFEARPCILSDRTGALVIIAGNQRYEAAKAVGLDSIPTFLLSGLSEAEEKEIIIRDNVNNGEWDFDALANGWGDCPLGEWGVDVPGFGIEEIDPPELKDGDRAPFKQMTFTLHDEQAEDVEAAIRAAKKEGCETSINENSNGNALAFICQRFNRG